MHEDDGRWSVIAFGGECGDLAGIPYIVRPSLLECAFVLSCVDVMSDGG